MPAVLEGAYRAKLKKLTSGYELSVFTQLPSCLAYVSPKVFDLKLIALPWVSVCKIVPAQSNQGSVAIFASGFFIFQTNVRQAWNLRMPFCPQKFQPSGVDGATCHIIVCAHHASAFRPHGDGVFSLWSTGWVRR